jgi:cytochrome c oxidase subunit II
MTVQGQKQAQYRLLSNQLSLSSAEEQSKKPDRQIPIEVISLKLKSVRNYLFAVLLFAPIYSASSAVAQNVPPRVEITAKRFSFVPGDITLKRGQPVVLVLKSEDVGHGIRIKELGVDLKAGKGQTSELAITPDKTGDFIGHCSVFCGAGHGSMTLTIHVVE